MVHPASDGTGDYPIVPRAVSPPPMLPMKISPLVGNGQIPPPMPVVFAPGLGGDTACGQYPNIHSEPEFCGAVVGQ